MVLLFLRVVLLRLMLLVLSLWLVLSLVRFSCLLRGGLGVLRFVGVGMWLVFLLSLWVRLLGLFSSGVLMSGSLLLLGLGLMLLTLPRVGRYMLLPS